MVARTDQEEEMDIMGMHIDAKKVLKFGATVSWLYLLIVLFTMVEVF